MVNAPEYEHRATILVVEKNPKIAEVMGQFLSIRGYDVIQARNIETAVVSVRNKLPDLIVVEAIMPGKSSFDFCRELKSNPLTELIPIIMVTALSDSRHVIEGIEAGADDFLSKPILAEELTVRVKSLLRRREAIKRRLLLSRGEHRDSEFDAFISHASEDKTNL